ncbi:MAG: glycosyltransferase family 4 protein [Armatimonadetes bacterium]|nr:glycosyltransferase family 4 protein [Armatimonadota bacterium]
MRVTLVQINLTGGVSTHLYHVQVFGLARRLAESGCEVTIITGEDHGCSVRSENRDGYEVIYLPVLARKMNQTLVRSLWSSIRESEPDVVQVAELIELTTLQTVLWCRLHSVPCVVWNGAYEYRGKWVSLQKAYLFTVGRAICRSGCEMIGKTTAAGRFLERLGAPPSRVWVIPVGLDTETFIGRRVAPPDTSWVPGEPFVMNVGQMTARKNQATLIRALKLIHETCPEFKLLLIGGGSEADSLYRLAVSLGVEKSVVMQRARVANSDLAAIYSRAFVTAIPSEYEIFGMTMLESLACGTPVIGRRTGGMADVIRDGVTGWLYDEDDPGFISETVLRIYCDRAQYLDFRRRAAEDSFQYDWKIIAPRFLEVYRRSRSYTREKE